MGLSELPMPFMLVVLVFLFVMGTVVGSFLNVCVHRLPTHAGIVSGLMGLWSPPSRCPRCFERIRLLDNIPIIGWLKLRGRCRHCRRPIPARYPLVELGNGLLFVLLYWIAATRWPAAGYEADEPWRFVYHLVLVEFLVVASLIDLDLKIIPDSVTLPAMVIGVLGGWIGGDGIKLVDLWFQDPNLAGPLASAWTRDWPHLHGLASSLVGLVVGGGVIWFVRLAGHWVLKQEAMGFGDVTLMAAIGSFLGWQAVLVVFFLAPISAISVGLVGWFARRAREIPYGPFLSLGVLVLLVAWNPFWEQISPVFDSSSRFVLVAVAGGALLIPLLMLTQLVKRLLGIPLGPPEWIGEWTSADQLAHFAGENADRFQGRWRMPPGDEWPGTEASRGTAIEQSWKHTTQGGHADAWRRRGD